MQLDVSTLSEAPTTHDRIVFGYCDYTSDGRPFYVGIGRYERVRHKIRNKKHKNVAEKHGLHRVVEMCVTGSDKDVVWKAACDWEILTIAERNTFHEPEKLGCNMTLGGDGNHGLRYVASPEACWKISLAKTKQYENPENRRILGEAISLAKQDPIKYQNHCKAQQLRYADPDERHRAHEYNTQKKRVQQLTLDGDVVAEFPSMSYAVQATGVKNVKTVCQGKRPFAGGFRWRYV